MGGWWWWSTPRPDRARRAAEELRDELPEAEVVELEEGDDLEAALKEAAGRGCAIGVAGGDGSINAAAAVAAEHRRSRCSWSRAAR